MAVWLVRVLDGEDPVGSGSSRFADVDAGLWWAPYVERLADLEVTLGCASGPARFCPLDSVSRAQMATFLSRAFDLASGPDAGFVDIAGSVHTTGINALAAAGVTKGCGTGPARFCPSGDVTRAQMSSFLNRAREYVPPEPRIAFSRTVGRQIWVMNADGSNPTRLTDHVGWNPVWSADSTRIAYHGGRDDGIRVVGADGTDRSQVTSDGGFHPVWHPDGTRFVYVAASSEVWLVNTDGTGRRPLVEGPVYRPETGWFRGLSPVWSPDGTRIAFATAGAHSSDDGSIWVMSGDGTGKRQVSDKGYSPRWSPDGDRLVYGVTYSPGKFQDRLSEVWVVDADGNHRRTLADNGRNPVWSPDGSRIAYVGDPGIYVIDPDGTNRKQLTSDERDQGPVWSPDSTRIAYSHGVTDPGIFVTELDGSGQRVLTWHGHDPSWSPDGTQVAYVGSDEVEFLVMNADGGNVQPLASLTADTTDDPELKTLREIVERAAWSPDGSRIAYNDGRSLYLIEADGTNRQYLAAGACGWVPTPLWSPDGRYLTYVQDHSTIVIIDPDNSTRTLIYDADRPAWSPDSSRLAYTNSGSHGIFVSGPGGENQKQIASGPISSIAWSSDSTLLAYTYDWKSIYVISADGHYNREVATPERDPRDLQWLPDGSRLVYNDGINFYLVDVNTGTQQKITDHRFWFAGSVLSPDGTRMVYGHATSYIYGDYGGSRSDTIELEPGHGIWIMGFDGENPEQLTTGLDSKPVWIQAGGTPRSEKG